MSAVMFSSKTDNWSTPQDFFDLLNEEFHFTLDPCADDLNHKCAKYYTKESNGLAQSWAGETVFCNPPYGRELPKWVKKCHDEAEHATVVMLIPARTDTRAFHEFIYGKAEIRFIRGRLKFGGSKNSAPFPSMLVIYQKEVDV
jgi:site-specific DNA-methyltransferase (adenine-specific)